jgi:hypothetical protein
VHLLPVQLLPEGQARISGWVYEKLPEMRPTS